MREVLCLSIALMVQVPLRAQCPDGSPPPCGRPAARGPAPNSVAVLYFDNLSRDTADAYLADGLTEEIIVRLGQVRRLVVKSRFEVQRVRGNRTLTDPATLGRTLGATYLVSGSVRKAGSRVRVNVELVRAASRARVWGDVFDRTSADILGIEEEIAIAAVSGIMGQILPDERAALTRRPTEDAQAYDLYLRGRSYFSQYTEQGIRRALDFYGQAVARDSTFATGWAALAEAWTELADYWVVPREPYRRAMDAAERAVALDSTSAAAVVALVYPVLTIDHDLMRAERLARRGIALDSTLPQAHVDLAIALWAQGRLEESRRETERAWTLDSLSNFTVSYHLYGLWMSRRYDDMDAFVQRVGTIIPASDRLLWEGIALIGRNDCRKAAERLKDATGLPPFPTVELAVALACAGRPAEARAELESLLVARRRTYIMPDMIAAVYAALGQSDSAFLWLERAYEENATYLLWLNIATYWDPIRDDPRFEDLVRRVGLPVPERH